jgi:hypothetical protein
MKRENPALTTRASAIARARAGHRTAALLLGGLLSFGASSATAEGEEPDSIVRASALSANSQLDSQEGSSEFHDTKRTTYDDRNWYSVLARSIGSFAAPDRIKNDVLGHPIAIKRPGGDGAFKLHLPMHFQVTADFAGTLSGDPYDRGVAAGGTSDARGLDWTLEANLGISRPLTKRTRIELGWRVIRTRSNFEIYDYDRSIWGIYLRTQLD